MERLQQFRQAGAFQWCNIVVERRQQHTWPPGVPHDQRGRGHDRAFGAGLCQCCRRRGLGFEARDRNGDCGSALGSAI